MFAVPPAAWMPSSIVKLTLVRGCALAVWSSSARSPLRQKQLASELARIAANGECGPMWLPDLEGVSSIGPQFLERKAMKSREGWLGRGFGANSGGPATGVLRACLGDR